MTVFYSLYEDPSFNDLFGCIESALVSHPDDTEVFDVYKHIYIGTDIYAVRHHAVAQFDSCGNLRLLYSSDLRFTHFYDKSSLSEYEDE